MQFHGCCAHVGKSVKLFPCAGSVPDIAMHVRMDFKSLPEPDWSVRKTNAFYYSKLILALHDLKCSGLVGLSPNSNEQKSFDTLLDYVSCGHLHVKQGECK
jgi:hypothetical protein